MSTLTQLFTSIANAIRAKKGTSSLIEAEDFPTEISTITTGHLDNEEYTEATNDVDDILEDTTLPTGVISITTNGTHNVRDYATANVNVIGDNNAKMTTSQISYVTTLDNIQAFITEIPLIDVANRTSVEGFFRNCRCLTTIPLIDTSNCRSHQEMFSGCVSLQSVPALSFQRTNNVSSMFNGCSSLTSVPKFTTPSNNILNIAGMFKNCLSLPSLDLTGINIRNVSILQEFLYNCSSLQDVTFGSDFNLVKITNMSNTFYGCTSLSNASLNNILGILPTATKLAAANKTLAYIGLTSEQATTCSTLSNWADAQTAGWTTGY